MFTILRRPGVIHLDCFTCIPEVKEFFELQPSKDFMPSWYKKLPVTVKHMGPNKGTMKTCPGVADLFRNGFVIPAWRDFYVEINQGVIAVDPTDSADIHHPAQWGEALKGYSHCKLISPWRVKEKTGVDFMFTNAFWHDNQLQWFVPNGIVNYKHQTTTNVNMVVSQKMFPNNFTIQAGTPLVQCIPLSDKKIKLHHHLVDIQEYTLLQSYHWTWSGQYYKNKKMREEKE